MRGGVTILKTLKNETLKNEQDTLLKMGTELFGTLKELQKNPLNKKWWYENIMQWTLANPNFKTALFRFVDVFPSLSKKKDIPLFFKEYLKANNLIPPFLRAGINLLPSSLLSLLISKHTKEIAHLFIAGETPSDILPVLKKIRKNNNAFTIDLLGEATLSEEEARLYQNRYITIMEQMYKQKWNHNPLTDKAENGEYLPVANLSLKITSLESQILTVAWEESKKRLKNKLRILFQKAVDTNTFINIDMEQYKYKTLTLELFKELVSEPAFKYYPHFGLVIQAYLKDALEDLRTFSKFLRNHSSPIHIRLVKGAYWDYELIHSRQNNWPCPVYLNKWESDINFEKCATFILQNYPRLRLAVGSHNIRSITHALHLSQQLNIPKKALEIQTLYGMADAINACLSQNGWRVRQYCPIGAPIPGMAYLVRRLLENTANESFIQSWQNTKNNIADMLKPPAPPPSGI